jgi:ankyrin repeat protein
VVISQSPSSPDPSSQSPGSDSESEESDTEDSNSDYSDSDSKDSSTLVNRSSSPQLEHRRKATFSYFIKADISSWPWKSLNYEKGKGPMLGWTALHLAVVESQETAIHLLIRYGAYIDGSNSLDRTPLYIAAEMGNLSIVNVLLEKGASEFTITTSRETPLFRAITFRRSLVARRLVNSKTMKIRNTYGQSTLHVFTKFSDEEGLDGVRLLLELGADIEAVDDKGVIPLHLASQTSDGRPTTRCLLEHRANIHARDRFGRTPLFYAVGRGSLESYEALVEYGATIDDTDLSRMTVLHLATQRGSLNTIQWLDRTQPSLMSMKTVAGCTPIHFALVTSYMQQWTLNQCPDLMLDCTRHCGSLLHEACRRGRPWTVMEIIERLSRDELHELCRKTDAAVAPQLTLAVLSKNPLIVQSLLDSGVDMNIAHPPWRTPLTEAVKFRREEIARVVLEHSYEALPKDSDERDTSNEKDDLGEKDISSENDAASARVAWLNTKFAELFDEPGNKAL